MRALGSTFKGLAARCAAVQARSAAASLFIGALMTSAPAFAELPTTKMPDGVTDGDLLGMWHGYAKLAINVFILIIGALAFIYVANGALERWKHYGKGKLELGDIKEYIVGGILVLVVVVALLTAANRIL